jgi:hypothetical protein
MRINAKNPYNSRMVFGRCNVGVQREAGDDAGRVTDLEALDPRSDRCNLPDGVKT